MCVWVHTFVCARACLCLCVFCITMHDISSSVSQTFDVHSSFKNNKNQFVCVQEVLPWQLPHLWPSSLSNMSVSHLLGFCGTQLLCLGNQHTHTYFRDGLRTVSNCGILLILASNLISMPQTHSRTASFVITSCTHTLTIRDLHN